MHLESTAKPEIKMAIFKKDETQIRKYRQRNKNKHGERLHQNKKERCLYSKKLLKRKDRNMNTTIPKFYRKDGNKREKNQTDEKADEN